MYMYTRRSVLQVLSFASSSEKMYFFSVIYCILWLCYDVTLLYFGLPPILYRQLLSVLCSVLRYILWTLLCFVDTVDALFVIVYFPSPPIK
jgi:hypothetical protein